MSRVRNRGLCALPCPSPGPKRTIYFLYKSFCCCSTNQTVDEAARMHKHNMIHEVPAAATRFLNSVRGEYKYEGCSIPGFFGRTDSGVKTSMRVFRITVIFLDKSMSDSLARITCTTPSEQAFHMQTAELQSCIFLPTRAPPSTQCSYGRSTCINK